MVIFRLDIQVYMHSMSFRPIDDSAEQEQHELDLEPVPEQYEFNLTPEQERYRIVFLLVLSIIFFIPFFKSPTIDHVKLHQVNHTDLLNSNSHTMGQRRRYAIYSIDNFIYLSVSGSLVLIFSILLKMEKRDPNEDDDRSGTNNSFFSLSL